MAATLTQVSRIWWRMSDDGAPSHPDIGVPEHPVEGGPEYPTHGGPGRPSRPSQPDTGVPEHPDLPGGEPEQGPVLPARPGQPPPLPTLPVYQVRAREDWMKEPSGPKDPGFYCVVVDDEDNRALAWLQGKSAVPKQGDPPAVSSAGGHWVPVVADPQVAPLGLLGWAAVGAAWRRHQTGPADPSQPVEPGGERHPPQRSVDWAFIIETGPTFGREPAQQPAAATSSRRS